MAIHEWKVIHKTHLDWEYGEVKPENLEWGIFLSDTNFVTYEIDMNNPLANKQYTNPYETDFVLQRDGADFIAGILTSVEVDELEGNTLKVAGKEWLHYLDIREYPFNPANPTQYAYSVVNRDIILVCQDLITTMQAQANSLQFTFGGSLFGDSGAGRQINYKVEPGDTEKILSKIRTLAQSDPGFDLQCTTQKQIIFYPYGKGNTKGGAATSYKLEAGKNIYGVRYTNSGIAGNHFLGTGAGTSSKVGVVYDDTVSQGSFRRIDRSRDFGDVKNASLLGAISLAESKRSVSPLVSFSCNVMETQEEIAMNLDVIDRLSLGASYWVDANIGWDHIKDTYRLVGIQGRVDLTGEDEISLVFEDETLSI